MSKAATIWRSWYKRVLTWGVTLALLGWVFHTVPVIEVYRALQAAGPVNVVGVFLVYYAYNFAADAYATWATFGWFCAKLRLKDVIVLRGMTYLLAVVNYNVGQGGIIYFVAKKHGVPVARATGTVLLTMGVTLVGLLLLAALGSGLNDTDPRLMVIEKIAGGSLVAFLAYLGVIQLAPRWLACRPVLEPLFKAGIAGHLKALLVRLPHTAGHVVFQWLLLRAFGIEIPFLAAAALLPVLFVVGWLPIAVQGLGTQQVAAIALFSKFALGSSAEQQAARVVAFTLSLAALGTLFNLVTGMIFFKSAAARQATAPAPGEGG